MVDDGVAKADIRPRIIRGVPVERVPSLSGTAGKSPTVWLAAARAVSPGRQGV